MSVLPCFQESDHSAADYLKKNRGMNLADDSISHFQYKVRRRGSGRKERGERKRGALRLRPAVRPTVLFRRADLALSLLP